MKAQEGVDWCKYCSVYPRNPCQNKAEAFECPNCDPVMKEHYRRDLPGYDQAQADELARYRCKYGPL